MNAQTRYILKRLGLSIIAIWAVATILFLMFRLMPGDPSTALADPRLSPETRKLILKQYGLTRPLHEQYYLFIENLLKGNLGVSFLSGKSVMKLIIDRAFNTLALSMTAVVLAFMIGPVIGAFFAWHRGASVDTYGTGAILLMYAAPVFWTGMIAIMVFSFRLGWLPSGGMHSAGFTPASFLDRFFSVDFFKHLVLPLSVTTLYYLPLPALIMRNNMIDVLGADFIELKSAEGLSEYLILYRHAARNALLPVFHYAAVAIGFAFGGSVLIETVFSWPGLGRMMWQAVRAQDYPLAQGSFLMLAVLIISLNFLVDILSTYIDPRVAEGE